MSADTKELIEAISSIVQGATALTVAIVAILGFSTWWRQMMGEKQYEAVRRLLLLVRQFRGEFGKARGPLTYPHEYEGRIRPPDERPEHSALLNEQYARQNRLQPLIEIVLALEQAAWEVEVITGEEIIPIAKPLGEVLFELRSTIDRYFTRRLAQMEQALKPDMNMTPDKKMMEEHDLVYSVYRAEGDKLSTRVDDAVKTLERKLGKYIR